MRRQILILLAASGLAFSQAAPPAPVPLPPDLDRVLRDYESAWQRRDAAALANLFVEDGFVLAQGRSPVRGRAAIQAAYAQAGGPLSLRALAYATEGALGHILGTYSLKPGEPEIGKFTLTLRRGADGRWLIFSDMDNPSQSPRRPAPTPTPAPVPAPAPAP